MVFPMSPFVTSYRLHYNGEIPGLKENRKKDSMIFCSKMIKPKGGYP